MSERYNSITVSVKITDNGRGMNRKQLEKLCARLVRSANAGSTQRSISAVTDPSDGPRVEAFWWSKDWKP
jgi:hypothetical protein